MKNSNTVKNKNYGNDMRGSDKVAVIIAVIAATMIGIGPVLLAVILP